MFKSFMFRSNIPLRIWGIFAGVLILTAFLCTIISYIVGLNSAAITVGSDNYSPREVKKLIEEYIDNNENLETELTELKDTYQRINDNYSALLQDFDRLNADYAATVNEHKTQAGELDRLTIENADLNYINENLRMLNLDLEAQIEEQNNAINSLNAQLVSQKNDNEQKNSEISLLQQRLDRIRDLFNNFVG